MRTICKECGEKKEHCALGLCSLCYHRKYRKEHPKIYRQASDKWRKNNLEKVREAKRKRRKKNPEIHRQDAKKWQKNNPEKKRAIRRRWARKWRKENPDKALEKQREWRKNNPDKIREQKFRRRSKGVVKKGVIEQVLNENIFRYGILTCEKCKEICLENYHIDHIVPISRGGNNDYNNLQVLCAGCNLKKHVKIADYRSRVKGTQLYISA